MNTINIALWATSLSLAVIGITFGVIASYNSKKANNKIRDILKVSFVAEEAQKLFFDQVKSSMLKNKKSMKLLKNKISYDNYSMISTHGRLIPLALNSTKLLYDTEFRDLSISYIKEKKQLDAMFFDVIKDTKILNSKNFISDEIKNQLIRYHEAVVDSCKTILKRYNQIISFTKEFKINDGTNKETTKK